MKKFTLLLSAMLLACATNLWAEDSWVKVSIDQLTSSDVFIIVDSTSGCAIPNNPKDQPLAVSIMKDGAWDFTNIADNLKWNITGNNTEGYVISPNGDATKRLYCTNTNNGVRVGTPTGTTYNLFWDATVDKLKQQVAEKTTRWIGCYDKKDWRCYDSGTANNIKGTVTRFYKLVTVANTVSVAVAEGQEDMGSVAMSYKANSNATEWAVATEPVELAGEGAEVFQFVATPKDGYKFAGWTTTGDITLDDKNAATAVGNSATKTSVVTANFERDATLTSLAISGTATKLNYFVGDTFDPAGLVVTATYSDGEEDDVTDQVDWTFDPETFDEAGTVSVEVTANIDAIYSETFTVNDIVVVDVDKYALVTNSTLLADGQHIIIVNADATYALSTEQKNTNRGAVAITANDSIIVPSEGVQIITLDSIMVEDAIKWELRVVADSYLYAASTKDNHLKTRKENSGDTQGQWTISIDAKGVATVKASGTERNWMRFNPNNGSPLFSCYKEKQNDIAIYARQYTVRVVSNDENMGSVSGDGKYFENNVAKLVATPKAGYKLTGWSNNSELIKNEQSLVVTEDITITAYFAKGETAIDNAAAETPALKTIENGQLVILRDGVKYNAMGVGLQ